MFRVIGRVRLPSRPQGACPGCRYCLDNAVHHQSVGNRTRLAFRRRPVVKKVVISACDMIPAITAATWRTPVFTVLQWSRFRFPVAASSPWASVRVALAVRLGDRDVFRNLPINQSFWMDDRLPARWQDCPNLLGRNWSPTGSSQQRHDPAKSAV